MQFKLNLLEYFIHASLVIKLVMAILLGASILSWAWILKRIFLMRRFKKAQHHFEALFWSGTSLMDIHHTLNVKEPTVGQLGSIFQAGFSEFIRLRQQGCHSLSLLLEAVSRAMHIAHTQAEEQIERHLDGLAIIGSSSPYIGLLGTVLGVMEAFKALVNTTQSATLALVAPGISEALATTAMGLFAAIPAVIFHNRHLSQTTSLLNQYEVFQEEFIALLLRQIYSDQEEKV